MNRWWVLAATVLAAIAWYALGRPEAAAPAGRPEVETAIVERRTMVRAVEAVGVVEPAFTLEVKSKASGQIVSMPHEEGDVVAEGTLLVELLPVDEERNLRTQRARVTSAEAQVAKARNQLKQARLDLGFSRERSASQVERAEVVHEVAVRELARQRHLFEKQLASQKAVDDARRAAEEAEASLELARNEAAALELAELRIGEREQDVHLQEAALEQQRIALEVAELRLSETRITAPMDGLILARNVERGQIIASGISNVSGGTALLTLADVRRLFLAAEVDESDIGGIRPGLGVELTAEAYPEETFEGRVERVAPRGETVQSVTIFRVRIELLGRAVELLRPGMNATAQIVLAREEDALVVPTQAIRRHDESLVVLVKDGPGEPRPVAVETGLRDGTLVQVRGDLAPGAAVVTSPARRGGRGGDSQRRQVRDGMRAFRRAGGGRR